MNENLVNEAISYIENLFKDNADGHDRDHTLRVYHNALKIAEKENCDLQILALTALLHDVDDHKLFNTINNENARRFLKLHNIPDETIETICNNINSISFSKNRGKRPETKEGQIVQDADRLDALGAIGIARTFAYGGSRQRELSSSIDHFHEKLLLLKDEMNTEEGKRLAEERHEFMLEFLRRYSEETQEQADKI